MDLRDRVFVGEQGVSPEEERDGLDDAAIQMVALDESGVVATCRLRLVDGGTGKLERMAVETRSRNLGVGGVLLSATEEEARSRGASEMVLNAQVGARRFWASHGYAAEGEVFMEAGIEHISMRKALDG